MMITKLTFLICRKNSSEWFINPFCSRFNIILTVLSRTSSAMQNFHAKYYFRHEEYSKAAELNTEVLSGLNHNGKESQFVILFFRAALLEIQGIAGEIFAANNQYEKSLSAFWDYHIYALCLKSTEAQSFMSFRRYSEYTLSDQIHNKLTITHLSMMNDSYIWRIKSTNRFQQVNCL